MFYFNFIEILLENYNHFAACCNATVASMAAGGKRAVASLLFFKLPL
jgi:hypothetical protein